MKFQVEAPTLQKAIEAASLPIRRGYIPIIECLHVIAKDNRLRLIGTNMDMEAQAQCEAAVSEAGNASVNADDLRRAVRGCKDIIDATMDGGLLRIETQGTKVALPCIAGEFPRLAKPEGDDEVTGAIPALKNLIPFMEGAQSPKPHLAGACLDEGFAVATTGTRVARFGIEGGKGQIIPVSAIPAILKVSDGRLFVGERTWRLEAENIALAGKLIEMNFAPWRRIVIDRNPICTFDADELLAALDRATLGRAKDVFVHVEDGVMTLTGERWPERHVDASATIRCDGADMQFLCYPGDLTECAKVFAGSVVELTGDPRAWRFNAAERPDDYTMMGAVSDARNRLPGEKVAA